MTVSKLVIELIKFADNLVDDRTTEGVFFEYDFENSGYSTDKLTAAGETLAGKLTDVLRPEWAEVSVSNLIEENRQLNERLAEREKEDVIALALWDGAVRELVKQRDSARSIAARLEAELAIAEQAAEVTTESLQPEYVDETPRCVSRAKFGMSELRCVEDVHGDDVQHRWGDLTW